MAQPLWKSLRVPCQVLTELPYDPATAFPGTYSKELRAGAQTSTSTHTFTAALFTDSQKVETSVRRQPNG